MNKYLHLLAGIIGSLLLVVFTLDLVGAIIAIKDIAEYERPSGVIGYPDIVSSTKGLYIFELVSAIIILLACIYIFVCVFGKKDEKKVYASILIPFTLLIISTIIDTFWAFKILQTAAGRSISMPGAGIAKLVFLFIGFISIIASIWLQGSFVHDGKANVFAIVSMFALFVCCIISFVNMNYSVGALVTISTIFLTLSIIVALALFIISYIPENITTHTTYKTGEIVYPRPKEVESDDTAEQLRKLKTLFDDGIITAEEYEEKRKKYVDKL